jgi:hypothetical protein
VGVAEGVGLDDGEGEEVPLPEDEEADEPFAPPEEDAPEFLTSLQPLNPKQATTAKIPPKFPIITSLTSVNPP